MRECELLDRAQLQVHAGHAAPWDTALHCECEFLDRAPGSALRM